MQPILFFSYYFIIHTVLFKILSLSPMIDEIKKLESACKVLEPATNKRADTRNMVMNYAEDFLNNISTSKTYVKTTDKGKAIYNYPISENGRAIEKLLEIIKENVDTPGLNPASGGHLGYIPGGGIYYSALGDYLAAVTNRYAGVFYANPGAIRMENMLLNWMGE